MSRLDFNNQKAYNWFLDFALDEYKEFVEFNQNHFKNVTTDLDKKYVDVKAYIEKNKGIDNPDYLYHIEERVYEEAYTLRNYETIFRTSVIIQVYTFMEVELKRFCRNYANIHKVKNKYTEIFDNSRISDLDRSKRFLKEHVHHNMSLSPHWNFIKPLSKLRNQLVHNGTIIQKKDARYKAIKDFSHKHYTFKEGENGGSIDFEDNDFLFKIINNVRHFLHELGDY